MKKVLTLMLALVMICSLAACGNNSSGAAPTENTPPQNIPAQTNPQQPGSFETDPKPVETEPDPTKADTLTELEIGLANGRRFVYEAEFGRMEISFRFDNDSHVVQQITASFDIYDGAEGYASMLTDFEDAMDEIQQMNDSNLILTKTDTVAGYKVFCELYGLNLADRSQRVAWVAEFLGFPYKESNYSFNSDALADELINNQEYNVIFTQH